MITLLKRLLMGEAREETPREAAERNRLKFAAHEALFQASLRAREERLMEHASKLLAAAEDVTMAHEQLLEARGEEVTDAQKNFVMSLQVLKLTAKAARGR
jgi:hypothetical protein